MSGISALKNERKVHNMDKGKRLQNVGEVHNHNASTQLMLRLKGANVETEERNGRRNMLNHANGVSGHSRSATRSQRMSLAALGDLCLRSPQKLKILGDPICKK